MKRQSTDGWTDEQRANFRVSHEFDSTAMTAAGLRAILKLLPDNAVVATDLESTSLKITLLVPMQEQEHQRRPYPYRMNTGQEPLAPVVLISRGTESVE